MRFGVSSFVFAAPPHFFSLCHLRPSRQKESQSQASQPPPSPRDVVRMAYSCTITTSCAATSAARATATGRFLLALSAWRPSKSSTTWKPCAANLRAKALPPGRRTSGATRQLLPIPEGFEPDLPVGFTPLVRARGLGKRIGAKNLYVKNDAVCFPTLSFKDRVVSVALANAQAFGFTTVGCSSTGNLANSVAAQAARLGLKAASWCRRISKPRRF